MSDREILELIARLEEMAARFGARFVIDQERLENFRSAQSCRMGQT